MVLKVFVNEVDRSNLLHSLLNQRFILNYTMIWNFSRNKNINLKVPRHLIVKEPSHPCILGRKVFVFLNSFLNLCFEYGFNCYTHIVGMLIVIDFY